MKKTHFIALLFLAISSLGLTVSFVTASKQNNFSYVEISATSESVEQYYSSISDTASGDTLLRALNVLNNQKRKKTVGYGNMRNYAKYFDADPDGSGKIVGFYDNALVGPNWDGAATWNREHVWPNVRGGSSVEDDAHMVRPASVETNSDRGSKGFSTASYDPGQFVEYYRGVASRIIFYCAIANLELKLVDEPLNYNSGNPANSMGALSDMLRWNLQYKPSDTSFTGANDLARRTEINRNVAIQTSSYGQGNRNPFIDHPEYACRIWGNTNAETRSICAGTQYDIEVEDISLDYSEYSLKVGETFKLNVNFVPENANVAPEMLWISSNNEVVSVDQYGLVTALKAGEANVSVIIQDKNLFASCKFTVSGAGSVGCGGDIMLTSTLLSVLSLIGISLILIKRFKYVFRR